MRAIDVPELSLVNSMLRSVHLGEAKIHGAMDVYSCKLGGEDRRLSKELEQQYVDKISSSPSLFSKSPIGDLNDAAIRKTLINLITTMNASFPDYDFSSLRSTAFVKEPSLRVVMNTVNSSLAEVTEQHGDSVVNEVWTAIYDTIQPQDCDVYSYLPDLVADPFSQNGTLWSFNFFFYNRKTRKILFFRCTCASKGMDASSSSDSENGMYLQDSDDSRMSQASSEESDTFLFTPEESMEEDDEEE